ncbi:MAG: FeoB-associated Cys-rich membrane protein [Pyrinomonadaceae bacterium]|nr:FeoB-associated Cys-rich membrane protein [Pyrinomonadaceae bacterium]
MFDWQSITVALIVCAAAFYVARRAYRHVRSFSNKENASCATGCGACDSNNGEQTSPVFVQIGRSASRSPDERVALVTETDSHTRLSL